MDGKPQEPKAPTPDALRHRLYRERKKNNIRVINLEIDFDDADTLVDAGYLLFEHSEDTRRIAEALKELLDGLKERHA